MKFIWLIFIFGTSQLCDAYKILVVFTAPSKSHNILGMGVVRHLLEAGHEVTYVTTYPSKDLPPGLHQIDVSDVVDKKLLGSLTNITATLNNEVSVDRLSMFELISMVTIKTMEHPKFVKILSDSSQKFDVVIIEWLFVDMYAGLSAVFDCPFIWVHTFDSFWMILQLVDERPNPAYVPDGISFNLPPLSFVGRVEELFSMANGLTLKLLLFNNNEKNHFEKILGPYIKQRGRSVPPFNEVRYNASLVLGNSHVSYGLAHKLPQNYKQIGGYHIDTDVKPLPDNLKNILDNAKYGVIYFSMGSLCESKNIPEVLKKGILKVFSKLKQTVIWKFEEQLPDLPKNVHIVNWAPQQSILSHPNCILFITHGGMLSTTETVHFGKPIIGIPVYGDQFSNIDRAVKKGYAIRVDLSYNMIGNLEKAIAEMLNDPKYSEKAKELSAIYHDRPVPPGVELVHWVEHVIRTRGAQHLRSPALGMPFYQKMYLDLIALILSVIFVLKIIIKRLCCSPKKVNNKKKNN